VPDELFFQTIIMNSEHRHTVVNDDLRYLDWTREPAPVVFTRDDLPGSSNRARSSPGSSMPPWTPRCSMPSTAWAPGHDDRGRAPRLGISQRGHHQASCWVENGASDRFHRSRLVRDLWTYRELARTFAVSTLRVRYKQAAFGVAWAILQPLLAVILFSIVFGAWPACRRTASRIRSSTTPR
jgi:hypothetical protein